MEQLSARKLTIEQFHGPAVLDRHDERRQPGPSNPVRPKRRLCGRSRDSVGRCGRDEAGKVAGRWEVELAKASTQSWQRPRPGHGHGDVPPAGGKEPLVWQLGPELA